MILGSSMMAFSNAKATGCNAALTSAAWSRFLLDNIAFICSMFSNGGTKAVTSNASFCVNELSMNITLPARPTPVNAFTASVVSGKSSPEVALVIRNGTRASCTPSGSLS